MADVKIDEATQDSAISGSEMIPVSDSGAPKSVTVEQIRDFVLSELSGVDESATTDISADGVYIVQGGVTKRLPEVVLAQAMMNYAFGLAGIATPNGNELFVIDDSGAKKTITLEKLTDYVTAKYADVFASLTSADPMAASDKIVVKQGNSVKCGTLGALAAFVQSTLAAYFGTCVNVLTVQDSDKIVVMSGGVIKTMLVSQFMAAMSAIRATVPATTTEGNVPTWADAEGGLGPGLAVQTTVRAQGIAANGALPTEAAVRAAIDAEASARNTAIENAIVGVGDVRGPVSTTENKVPQWGSTAKNLKDGLAVTTSIGSSAADTKLPTEKAVRSAIEAEAMARDAAIEAEATARGAAIAAEATARDAAIAAAVGSAVSGLEKADAALGARIDEIDAITGPQMTTSGKVPQWDSTNRALKDGLTVKTSVGALANTSDTAIPTEKAVRTALNDKISPPASHVEDCIPTWGASNELKPGLAVATTLASNGSNNNIPTEKAVRDAMPVAVTASKAGLMSAADKVKLDNLVDTGSVVEIGAALADGDTVIVKQGDSTSKKSLMSRFWTYIMGKLPTFKIDDLAAGDDNTDLNASSAKHGLCPKLSGDTSQFLRGDGTFAAPEGSEAFTGTDGTNAGAKGLVPAPATTDANKFLKADGTWTEPPSAAGVDIPGATAIDAPADADLVYLFDASAAGYRKATLAQMREMMFGTKRYDTMFIPAGAMTPSNSDGATPGAVKFVDATHDTMAFPATADKSVEFSVAMPDDWDGGAVKAKVLWTFYDSTAGQSGQHVRWMLGAVAVRDGDDISDSPTAYTNIDDVTQSANELCRTGASEAITAEGTVESGGFLHFMLKRDADYAPTGGTALGTEALALGVVLQFGRTADFTGW